VSQPDQLPSDEHPSKGFDRRMVLRSVGALGVGAVGAVTLMAFGGGAATTAGGAAAGAGSADLGKTVVKTSDIPVGGGEVFDATKVVVTQPKAGSSRHSAHSARTWAAPWQGSPTELLSARATEAPTTPRRVRSPAVRPLTAAEQDSHGQRRFDHRLLTCPEAHSGQQQGQVAHTS
jgi:hypothetical protein